MTENERDALKQILDEQVKLVWALSNHPDLPQHGDTRPILLGMIERLKRMNDILKGKPIIITGAFD